MARIAVPLAIAALLAVSASARADEYVGTFSQGPRIIPATLTFMPDSRPGDIAGARFGQPWQCSLRLVFVGVRDGAGIFSVNGSNGGRCDLLLGGTVQTMFVGAPQEGMLDAGFFNPRAETIAKLRLRRRE